MPWFRMSSHNRSTERHYQDGAQERPSTPLNLEDFSSENTELLDNASEFLSDVLGCADASGSISSVSSSSAIHASQQDRREQNRKKKKPVAEGNKKVVERKLPAGPKKLAPPKKVRSAYVMYLKDSGRDRSMKWTELSKGDKNYYVKLSQADEQRYVMELERYNEKLQEELSLLRGKMHASTQNDISAAEPMTKSAHQAVVTPDQMPDPKQIETSLSVESRIDGRVSTQASNHRHLSRLLDEVQFAPNGEESIPLPAGLEVNVSHQPGVPEQRYQIQYDCVSMTMEQASQYIQNLGSTQIARNNRRN